jgi:hypothetical protein
MATYAALAATTSALLRLFADGFPTSLGVPVVESFDPDAEADEAPHTFLWLYRFVPVAATMRNRPAPGAPRPEVRPGLRPSPVAVDLHYLLWTRNVGPAAAQTVVGWALRRLSDRPILTNDKLNQGGSVFKPTEDVSLLVEELSNAELAELTRPLGPILPFALPIHARSIHLEGE